MSKKNFDKLLQTRFVPPPSTNLSERIIRAASRNQSRPFWVVCTEELMDMLIIPRPVYALAFCIMFGLVLGAQIPLISDTGTQDYFSFLTYEEGDLL